MNEIILSNENINCLALTTMVEKCVVNPVAILPYNEMVKLGWQFYFKIKDNIVYAIMEGNFPHKHEFFAKEVNPYISQIIKSYNHE